MPLFVDNIVPTDPTWLALHRIADAAIPEVRDLYITITRRMRARLNLATLAAHFAEGRIGAAINSATWFEDLAPLDAPLEAVLIAGANVAAAQLTGSRFLQKQDTPAEQFLADAAAAAAAATAAARFRSQVVFPTPPATTGPVVPGATPGPTPPGAPPAPPGPVTVVISVDFESTNPAVEAVIRARRIRLKGGITAQSTEAVREIISEAFREGFPPRVAAKMIRDVVGLNTRQVRALARFRRMLVRQGITGERLARVVAREAAKKLRFRAMMIARQETMLAANKGQEQLWAQQVDKGFLKPNQKRTWIDTGDPPRECPICVDAANQIVGLFEFFKTTVGPVFTPQEAHVMCRCTEGLV